MFFHVEMDKDALAGFAAIEIGRDRTSMRKAWTQTRAGPLDEYRRQAAKGLFGPRSYLKTVYKARAFGAVIDFS